MALSMNRLCFNFLSKIRISQALPTGYKAVTDAIGSNTIVPFATHDQRVDLHLSAASRGSRQLRGLLKVMPNEPEKWPKYNDIVYTPRQPGEPKRPAEVTHFVANVKYSTKKLWYLASLVRGLSIDEAIKQMTFQEKKGSQFIKRALEEAQELAVRDHNVEYKSNMFIADSRALKGHTIKGYRKHLGTRMGVISYRYSHYLVRLREGKPPKHYYEPKEKTGYGKMEEYIKQKRARTIRHSL